MWTISLTLCIIILVLWITWRKRKLLFFQRLNIPGPPPNLLFGNYWELLHEGQDNCINRWVKEYGKVFGYYYGLSPVLIVTDLELLRHIQQKNFQNFSSRPSLFVIGSSSSRFNNSSITTLSGKRWKELRSILTPTFTTSKLKKMSPIINGSINELVERVERESEGGKAFDIGRLYQNLTMDVIARTSLGIHTNAQKDANDPFVRLARLIFSLKTTYLVMFTFSFKELMPVFSLLRFLRMSWTNKGKFPREELLERTAAAVEARRSNPQYRRQDVLQLMIDAQRTEENVNDNSLIAGENDDPSSNEVKNEIPLKTGKGMTDDEIVQNAGVFLLAGYETTSTALAFLTFALIYHQDIQDKVREEIKQNISDNDEITYEVVHKLPYLDNVLNETLRLYPPITYFVNRQAAEDVVIDNYRIPKNIALQVPVYYLHHDPTVWEDPEKFDPDRFLPENKKKIHPMAFQPFGAGPRNCIGMRFAQMEAKMAIVTLLRKYRLVPERGTKEEDFEICRTILTMRPEKGVFVRLERI